MSELEVLQAVRLKGRVSEAQLAATIGEDPAIIGGTVEKLSQAGLVVAGKTVKISPDGRVRLAELLEDERSAIDKNAMAAVYNDFRGVNADFKAVVSDWQLKDGQPNAHEDANYDALVLARLDGVHDRAMRIIAAAGAHVPRLNAYAGRLSAALQKVKAGDTSWLTRPIIDSYHTVWFELHEDLILATGGSRDEEARLGLAD